MKNWLGIAPTGRPFVKMQGLRNHFVIVDGRTQPFKPSISEIVSICDIETGPGAEQLMVIEPVSDAGEGAYARVRIYNPDGEEAEACGNATRCVAKLLFEEAGLDDRKSVVVPIEIAIEFSSHLGNLIRCAEVHRSEFLL